MAKKPFTKEIIEPGVSVYSSPNPSVQKKFLGLPDRIVDEYARDPKKGDTMHQREEDDGPVYARGGAVRAKKAPYLKR